MADEAVPPAGGTGDAGGGEWRALEAETLRARVGELSTRLERLRRERNDLRRQLERRAAEEQEAPAVGPAVPPGQVLVDAARYEELRQAQRDLVRLLRRLGRPPLGWALRRQSGYRRLRQRWLREG